MELYDIKHPLRGEEYENYKFTQPFADKILSIASEPKGFFKYVYDYRNNQLTSYRRAEEIVKKLSQVDSYKEAMDKWNVEEFYRTQKEF
jgi:hypothetical protein